MQSSWRPGPAIWFQAISEGPRPDQGAGAARLRAQYSAMERRHEIATLARSDLRAVRRCQIAALERDLIATAAAVR